MSAYVVLTAVGPDRPGLVDEISSFLADNNINIEDSRMAVLGGEFAVIMLTSGVAGFTDLLGRELARIEKTTGLSIKIRPTLAPHERKMQPSLPYKFTATSMDHPGIVHEITRVFHQHSINIESMDTHVTHAPVSGTPIFNMKCIINIPAGEKLSSVRRELEELGDRMDIDIEIVAVDTNP